MNIISVREQPQYTQQIIAYLQQVNFPTLWLAIRLTIEHPTFGYLFKKSLTAGRYFTNRASCPRTWHGVAKGQALSISGYTAVYYATPCQAREQDTFLQPINYSIIPWNSAYSFSSSYFLQTVRPANKPIHPGNKPIVYGKPAGYLSGQLKSLKAVPA